MPLSKPIVAVVALFSFTGPLGDFILSSTILRTPDKYTLPIGLYNLVAQKMGASYTTGGVAGTHFLRHQVIKPDG